MKKIKLGLWIAVGIITPFFGIYLHRTYGAVGLIPIFAIALLMGIILFPCILDENYE